MAGVSGAARFALWAAAVVAGVVSLGLIGVAVMVDLDTADRVASVAGAVVALVGLFVAVVALTQPSSGRGMRRVRTGRGGVAAGGDMGGNAIGDRSKVTSPRRAPGSAMRRRGADDVIAGRGGVASGGDMRDNAIGDDSERG